MSEMGSPIGRGEAIQTLLAGIHNDPRNPFVVLEESIRERPFGWVISSTSNRYLETRDAKYLPFGDLTWIVDRHDRAVHAAGPAQFIDRLAPGFLNGFLSAYQLECSVRHGRGFRRLMAYVRRTCTEAAARYRASWQPRPYCSRGWSPLRFPR